MSTSSAPSGANVKISAKKEGELYKKDYGKQVGVGSKAPKAPPSSSAASGINAGKSNQPAKDSGDTKGASDAKPPAKTPKVEVASKALYKAQASGEVTRWGDEDSNTFATFMAGKASAEALAASANLNEKKAKLTLVNAKAEGTVAHAQLDIVGAIKKLFGLDPEPPAPAPGGMSPMAARLMDLTTHGTPLAPGPGSPNVFIGSLPAWRATLDVCACAAPSAAPHGAGPSMIGEATVHINSMPAIRVGDWVTESSGGPNVIVQGCPTVFIGTPAGPAPAGAPGAEEDPEQWIIFESIATADLGAANAEAKAEASADLGKRKAAIEGKAGASAALAKASLPLKVRIRVPFTSYYAGLGVTGTATAGSAGAEAGGSLKINDGKKLFEGSAGAGAHLGVGLSAKFSFDISEK